MQINADASLSLDKKKLTVTSTNTTGAVAELGNYQVNTANGFLTFNIKNTINVGSGIQVLLEVATNSQSGYTGNNLGRKTFRDDPNNQVGRIFLVSLEFYDALGVPGNPSGVPASVNGTYSGSNNLPQLRNMYVVSDEFSGTDWITLPVGLKDADYNFVDQATSVPGTQITPTVVLTAVSGTDNRRLEVRVQGTSVSKPTVGLLGFYQKGGPDGAYLTFSISEVRKVGSGIQVVLNVVSNSLSNYSGTRTDKVAFKNDFPAGTKIVTSLEFYDAAGNPGNPNSDPAPVNGAYDNGNNVPKLRNMYEVGTCQPSPN